jgi:hypothetical protein
VLSSLHLKKNIYFKNIRVHGQFAKISQLSQLLQKGNDALDSLQSLNFPLILNRITVNPHIIMLNLRRNHMNKKKYSALKKSEPFKPVFIRRSDGGCPDAPECTGDYLWKRNLPAGQTPD